MPTTTSSRLGIPLALAALIAAPVGCASLDVASPAHAKNVSVAFRNSVTLPDSTVDQFGQAFTITGLSGITYLRPVPPPAAAGTHEFAAVMDNSDKLVRINVVFTSAGGIASATVVGGVKLDRSLDFEGVAIASTPETPGATTLLLAEETTPGVHEFRLSDGSFVRTLPTPSVFAGRRSNFGFESLASRPIPPGPISPSTRLEAWTANEEALANDGPISSPTAGTVVRLQRMQRLGGVWSASHQLAYVTEPMHGSTTSGARSGVSDLVALPDGQLLVLERSFAFNLGGFFRTRIYQVNFNGASDVAALPSLVGVPYTPVGKRLVYQGNQANLEGLCVGPRLEGIAPRWAMLGVVDDADPISQNTLVAFEVTTSGPQTLTAR
jgi:hypothetical protein